MAPEVRVTPKAEAYSRSDTGRSMAHSTLRERYGNALEVIAMAKLELARQSDAMTFLAALACLLCREWEERAIDIPVKLERTVAALAVLGEIRPTDALAVLRDELSVAWVETCGEGYGHDGGMRAMTDSCDDRQRWERELGTAIEATMQRPRPRASLRLEALRVLRRRVDALRAARAAVHALLDGEDERALDSLRAAGKVLGAETRGDVWRAVAEAVDRREASRRCSSCAAILRPRCEGKPDMRRCRVSR